MRGNQCYVWACDNTNAHGRAIVRARPEAYGATSRTLYPNECCLPGNNLRCLCPPDQRLSWRSMDRGGRAEGGRKRRREGCKSEGKGATEEGRGRKERKGCERDGEREGESMEGEVYQRRNGRRISRRREGGV